ncbi:hypothetical protein GJ744_004076 [Endocarpon pusillum]|uniref:cyclin-dependent kinase n=1 Tax=Endocarpon pusillum TaxID=364733 RepID=A0A8H7ALY9_9EURO|nr:hypothetical protein GJ744_004076 [Endocarpon pusillum]
MPEKYVRDKTELKGLSRGRWKESEELEVSVIKGKSRWAQDEDDSAASIAQRKREKEEQRRAKEDRLRQADAQQVHPSTPVDAPGANGDVARPSKRLRTHVDTHRPGDGHATEPQLLPFPARRFAACRDVDEYERLNEIEEGSYGLVSRAREKATGSVVALKKLKMDHANDGFPVTGLREIQTLMASRHAHIVRLREVVTGSTWKDIYLVMDFLEHDLKTLLEDMAEPFLPSEIKTLMLQIVSATQHLHSHWILHRDLKTSNLLMNNRGEIKLADFGMARYTSQPPPPKLTQLVVTLWYRSPELLLGTDTYGAEIDIWSLGCIFGELLTRDPMFQGKNEVDQLSRIFALLGPPTRENWPDFRSLPNAKALHPLLSSSSASKPQPQLNFPYLTTSGHRLLSSMLSLNPSSRPPHPRSWPTRTSQRRPRPKPKEFFPTFPSKAGQERRRRRETPNAPLRGEKVKLLGVEDFARESFGAGGGILAGREEAEERGSR